MVYRHLAWINALRLQLRSTSRFFDKPARATKRRLENHAEHMRNDWDEEMAPFLSEAELAEMSAMVNPAHAHRASPGRAARRAAARAADRPLPPDRADGHPARALHAAGQVRAHQGRRRSRASTPSSAGPSTASSSTLCHSACSTCSTSSCRRAFPGPAEAPWIVTYLLAAGVIGWVFLTMEGVGDASEDPFERSMNDVPMNALCRVIERDLRQMLGETELPAPEAAKDGVLY